MHTRIEAIGEMVKKGMITADIGTDHALLPVYLIQHGKSEKVYACDIHEGPLRQAEQTIHRSGLEGQIIPVLSDGFEKVPEDADCAVIAGMGFETASAILEKGADRWKSFRQIITDIHGNHGAVDLRRWLRDHGCVIDEECFMDERGHGYTIISFHAGNGSSLSDMDIVIGPCLRKIHSQCYRAYLLKRKGVLDQILARAGREKIDPDLLYERKYIELYLNEK